MSPRTKIANLAVGLLRDARDDQTAILDAIPDHIALLGRTGVIVTVNAAWRRFGLDNGLRAADSGVGANYLTLCDRATGEEAEEAAAAAAGIRRVLDGSRASYSLEYPCHSAHARRWFRLTATPMADPGRRGAVLMHQEVSEAKFAAFAAEQAAGSQADLMAELAVERARLVAAQAVAKVGSWETNLRSLEVLWSAETFHIFGLDESSFHPTHATFLEHCHPDDRARVDTAFQASVNTRALCTIEHRIVLGDGSIKQVEERWHTELDGLGAPIRAVGTCQDTTEQRAAIDALLRSEERFRQTFDSAPVGILIISVDGRITDANTAFCRLLGYAPVQLRGRPFLSLTHPDDRPDYLADVEGLIDGRQREAVFEKRFVAADGRIGWARVTVAAPRDPSGRALYLIAMVADITREREAQEAVRLSEERFRQTFDSAPMGIVITASDGRFTEANIAFRQMVGYTSDELRDHRFVELTHPDDRAASLAAVTMLVSGRRETVGLEKRYLTADGRTVWARVSIAASRDEAGEVLYFITAVEDITREYEAREALATSEERFRLLSKAANDGIYDWDLEANTVWRNEGFEELYGHTIAALGSTVGGWADLIHPDDRERVIAGMRRAFESGAEQWSGEYRFRRKDGRYAHVLDQGHIVRNAEGRAIRMIGANTDLTSRKEAELRLAQQAALLDAAHDAILVKDMDDRITYWNKGAERNYGWLASEVIGRRASELFHVDPVAYQEARALLLDRGQWEGELVQRGKDERVRDVAVRWSLVRDDRGYPTAILAITSDVTERKRLEMQFLRAQRHESLGTLAGGIAHDLNNVLAPILVSIELLRTDDRDPERLESLATIEASAKRGAAMVQQVLTFARGVEGKRIPIEVARIARDVEKIARDTFPKGITIRLTSAPDLWTIQADATQMHQVLTNLCVNARDAMPHGGTLTISLSNATIDEVFARMNPHARRGPYVAVAVGDTGVGIPPLIQQRLFEPFFTTKEVGKGTGLGLSTVYSIVHSHRGFINLYSEVGKGAKFTIYLPALVGAVTIPDDEVLAVRLPRGNGELILVVDDEESIRSIVQRTLERFGYRVMLAGNGAEGVAQFVEHRKEISVVLTDMAMPVMDGPAMIAALFVIDPKVRIMASSGLTSGGSVADALAAGVTEFVSKPYTAETLLTSLYKVLHGRSSGPRLPIPPGTLLD